ncbi:hypothetical protein GCM10011507_28660 [Edaphobacter acidisoli]|uniref:Uncharacterized protein n=1 Tax=Edaphobacter acidisoli TaxID=2040573 RepID=A0A916RXG6_9BACT|nr:hypothetical protein [Edaphobacter acidisoli]GGA75572.1 hypothetical protein GCM10011507_28660 [Edaphobacter acidisoli]
MKSQKSHSLRTIPLLAAALALSATAAHAREKKAPPVKPANQYAAFDQHPNEKLTIAAEPCTDPKDCDFFRLPYIEHGFIPIRIVFTNDGDTALTLDDVRIQLITSDNTVVPAATDDDLNRRLFTTGGVRGTPVPLPAPLPPIHIHRQQVDKKITQDDDDFGFSGTVVNAHSTLAGYLFYDVRGLDAPPLKDASIYVKEIWTMDRKKELFSYTIPLNKWLATQPH